MVALTPPEPQPVETSPPTLGARTAASSPVRLALFWLALAVLLYGLALGIEWAAERVEKHLVAQKKLNGPQRHWDLPTNAMLFPPVDVPNHDRMLPANSGAFVGPERTRKKPPGVYRIVVAGDSMTFPFGLPYEQGWVAQLEARLNARLADRGSVAPDGTPRRVELLNLAMPGLNVHTAFERYDHTINKPRNRENTADAEPFEHDAVWYGFFPNDAILDRYAPPLSQSCPALMDRKDHLREWLIDTSAVTRLAYDGLTLALYGYPGVQVGHAWAGLPGNKGLACAGQWLKRFDENAKAGGRAFRVVLIPGLRDRPDVPDPATPDPVTGDEDGLADRRFREYIAQLGLPVVSIHQGTLRPGVNKWQLVGDPHPDARAQTMFADLLLEKAGELGVPGL
jgi:hypothetical protein